MGPRPPRSTRFPYTTLFRSDAGRPDARRPLLARGRGGWVRVRVGPAADPRRRHQGPGAADPRSEEHTSELQSQSNLVCRLLLEKKKDTQLRLLGHLPTTRAF